MLACHCQLAQVEVTGNVEGEMVIFCPAEEITRNSGAAPAMCVTKVGGDGKAVLSIENHLLHPVILKQEEVLYI